jgi:hypothetical protein
MSELYKNFLEDTLAEVPKYVCEITNWYQFYSLFACLWICMIYLFDGTRLTMQRYKVVIRCVHFDLAMPIQQ